MSEEGWGALGALQTGQARACQAHTRAQTVGGARVGPDLYRMTTRPGAPLGGVGASALSSATAASESPSPPASNSGDDAPVLGSRGAGVVDLAILSGVDGLGFRDAAPFATARLDRSAAVVLVDRACVPPAAVDLVGAVLELFERCARRLVTASACPPRTSTEAGRWETGAANAALFPRGELPSRSACRALGARGEGVSAVMPAAADADAAGMTPTNMRAGWLLCSFGQRQPRFPWHRLSLHTFDDPGVAIVGVGVWVGGTESPCRPVRLRDQSIGPRVFMSLMSVHASTAPRGLLQ
jgi:hypothetical protein